MKDAIFRGFLALTLVTGTVQLRADFTDLAGLVPADTDLFLRMERIDQVLEQFAPFVNDYLERDRAGSLHRGLRDFQSITGVDLLSAYSLKQEGIDTRRPMAVAWLDDFGGSPAFCIILPILNPDTYPLRFAEIVNLIREERGEKELFPVISGYHGRALYRLGRNLVVLTLGDYLLVTDSLLLAREAVNLYRDSSGSLAQTSGYVEFRETWRKERSVHIYAGPKRSTKEIAFLAGDVRKDRLSPVRYRRICLGTESNRIVMETLLRFEEDDTLKELFPEGKVPFLKPEKERGTFRITAFPGLREYCERKDDNCPACRTIKARLEYHYGQDFWNTFTSPGGKGFALYPGEKEEWLLERSCKTQKKARDIVAALRDLLEEKEENSDREKESKGEQKTEVTGKEGILTLTSGKGETWYLRRVEEVILLGNNLEMVRQANDPDPLTGKDIIRLKTGSDLKTWLEQTGLTKPMSGYLLPSLKRIEMTGERIERGIRIRYEYHLRKAP